MKVNVGTGSRTWRDVLHFRGSGTLGARPGVQLQYQARSDEDGGLAASELAGGLRLRDPPQRQQLRMRTRRPHRPAPATEACFGWT